jgi:2-iminoacetate synthase ThiH
METNEAPDKIFLIRNISSNTALNTTNDCHNKYLCEWYKSREKDTDVEYTRTDALIEKACVKLKKLMYDNLMFQGRLHRGEVIDNFVEDFKNYIKGE